MKSGPHPILLYDGHCALCNTWVRLLLALDSNGRLRFAKLQSQFAAEILQSRGLYPTKMESVVLFEPMAPMGQGGGYDGSVTPAEEGSHGVEGRIHHKSDAILHAIAHLSSPWKFLRCARYFPRGLRDRLYDFIARHRYDWFGRHESCPLPPIEHRSRFLDLD